jgi:hypothetical protein
LQLYYQRPAIADAANFLKMPILNQNVAPTGLTTHFSLNQLQKGRSEGARLFDNILSKLSFHLVADRFNYQH